MAEEAISYVDTAYANTPYGVLIKEVARLVNNNPDLFNQAKEHLENKYIEIIMTNPNYNKILSDLKVSPSHIKQLEENAEAAKLLVSAIQTGKGRRRSRRQRTRRRRRSTRRR